MTGKCTIAGCNITHLTFETMTFCKFLKWNKFASKTKMYYTCKFFRKISCYLIYMETSSIRMKTFLNGVGSFEKFPKSETFFKIILTTNPIQSGIFFIVYSVFANNSWKRHNFCLLWNFFSYILKFFFSHISICNL